MLFQRHVIKPNRIARPPDLVDGRYPIGLSIDQFLDFFSDVKKLVVDGFIAIDNSLASGNSISDIMSAIQALTDVQNNSGSWAFLGEIQRIIKPTGIFAVSGEDPLLSATPTTTTDYPYFSFANGVASIIIDLGKSLFFEGRIYPFIDITFFTGHTSRAIGEIVGSVSFANYGEVPIYSGGNTNPLAFVAVVGSIDILERYSDIRISPQTVTPGGTVVLSSSTVSGLNNYIKAYFGPASVNIAGSSNRITIPVPNNAKSGPIRLESLSPQFDSFLTYESVRIL